MIIREMKREDNAKVKEIIQDSLESLGLTIPGSAYYDPQLNDLHQYYARLKHANYWVAEIYKGNKNFSFINYEQAVIELAKYIHFYNTNRITLKMAKSIA